MSLEIAVIKTEQANYAYDKKIYGLYPLERNIFVLSGAGIKKIYLDLSGNEKELYIKKIKSRLKRLSNTVIIDEVDGAISSEYLSVPSNLFTQVNYFTKFDKYFTKKGNIFVPILNDDQFLLLEEGDFNNAVYLGKKFILDNTDGYIARNVNKKISIPLSTILSKTGIHPNVLTIFNLIIGVLSSVFLLFNTYWYTVLGGTFFQLASVMDGVDGEVAKFTFKTSKIGSWLDTITDNLTLLLFLGSASYLYYIHSKGLLSLVFIALIFAGVFITLFIMFRFLRRYSSSRSLVIYDKEFIRRLPQNDPIIIIINKFKYFTKKEFFSYMFFGISFTGKIYYLVPVVAICLAIATIMLIVVDLKYLKKYTQYIEND